MVSDSLVEQCHLMSTCFPEEDDLDAMGDIGGMAGAATGSSHMMHNDSKSKKAKKKRSGSFQGMLPFVFFSRFFTY